MSLGGLALGVGMLVDNSIVVLENIFRHRERGLHGAAAAAVGTEEVISAIIGATLTTVAVFGPIIYVQGVAGQLFGAVSYAVSFSLLASLVGAMLLVPTIAARWGADSERTTAPTRNPLRLLGRFLASLLKRIFGPLLDAFDRIFTRFIGRYELSLEAALRHRGRVVAFAALLLVLAVGAALTLDRAVLPSVEQGTLRLRIELPRGTPIEETARVATHVESVLLADSAVTAVFTRVGRQDALAGIDLEESGLNTALLEVRLGPKATSRAVIERARGQLAGYPPGVVSVDAGQATALGRLLGGGEAELAIRVRGDDLDQALDYARALTDRLGASADLTNVRLGAELGQPEIRVEIDRERAAAFGIEPIRIAQTIEKYMLGTRATDLVDFDRKIPIIVSLPDEARRSLETLDILRVDGIPLRELVRTHESVGPTEIQRVNQARLIPIYADGRGRDLTQAFAAAQQVVDQNPAPAGIRAEIGGENEEMRRSFRDLAFAFTLAILLVYMILAAEFESLVHPFTVLLSIPLAVVGAVLALRVTGAGLNAMSLIGIVILVGIAVNNAIVMVDFVNQMRRKGLDTRDAILESARARLRPIVMTTVTTLLGIRPMAIGIGRGADLRAPLAIAIFGGLFTSTALTLIVVPVAYDLVDGAGRWLQARFRGAESIVRSAPVTAQAHDAAATANEAGTREVPAGD
jgi:HAE1 family hydrophobic/amphiphilic exporter-1